MHRSFIVCIWNPSLHLSVATDTAHVSESHHGFNLNTRHLFCTGTHIQSHINKYHSKLINIRKQLGSQWHRSWYRSGITRIWCTPYVYPDKYHAWLSTVALVSAVMSLINDNHSSAVRMYKLLVTSIICFPHWRYTWLLDTTRFAGRHRDGLIFPMVNTLSGSACRDNFDKLKYDQPSAHWQEAPSHLCLQTHKSRWIYV